MRVRGRPAVVLSLPCLFAQLGVQAGRTPLQIRPTRHMNETKTAHTFVLDKDAGLLSFCVGSCSGSCLNIWPDVSVNLEPISLFRFFI